ncbi:radical SAM domain protein [Desulfocucumis palustris]|uniref:Radical SAM domain protein n=1 Tax=Desulfocucumis palustris TaxID=1898651 RepID=A0A2L2XLB9_9FIRM|nr:radical SAM protein [Desulfocucumis palustris]GBF35096.1 radical SAM domain protein [Desulfocucumis palustris]
MKILLLEHPRKIARGRCNDIANTPLSSCLISGYAAGMLAAVGHEAAIVEGYLDGLSYEQIRRQIKDFGPDILGVHMVYQWGRDQELFVFLEDIKNEGSAPLIIAYGFYPTFAYEEILRHCRAVDAIILGEPEYTFARLAEKSCPGTALQGISGLARRDGSGNILARRREPLADPELLPFPLRTKAMLGLPEINIEGSRGCYGGCAFCYINSYYMEREHTGRGKVTTPGPSRWRGRSPENITAEIDLLMAEFGKRDFYFVDPNFFGPGRQGQERALRLAGLLKERGIRFGIEARVNDIHQQTIEALAEAGLRNILVGLESGRDESLKRLNKMTTVAQNEKALKILRRHGIEPNVGFIMFEPDSTLEDLRINFEFLQRNDLLGDLPITANVLYHPQIILQGTRAYHKLQEEGRLQLLSTTYEGTAGFANPRVAALAQIMSGITNYLFVKMEGIWSGKAEEPKSARAIYAKLNRSLIKCFADTLHQLETGKQFSPGEIEDFVFIAEQEIDNM